MHTIAIIIHNKEVQLDTPLDLGTVPIRRSVRVALFDEDGKVAFIEWPSGELSIIGGGIDAGETALEALAREVQEEAGCGLKNIVEVGKIFEKYLPEQKNPDWPLWEEACCYQARVAGEKGTTDYQEGELTVGASTVWLPLNEAIERIARSAYAEKKTRTLVHLRHVAETGTTKAKVVNDIAQE